jgi:hypothetical protein
MPRCAGLLVTSSSYCSWKAGQTAIVAWARHFWSKPSLVTGTESSQMPICTTELPVKAEPQAGPDS